MPVVPMTVVLGRVPADRRGVAVFDDLSGVEDRTAVSGLDAPGRSPAQVLADRRSVRPGALITSDDLRVRTAALRADRNDVPGGQLQGSTEGGTG